MKKMIRILLGFLFTLVFFLPCEAQDAEMADVMRSEGKIYVVVAIILLVLTGLIFYLFLMDRKVNNLEKMINDKRKTK